MAIYRIFPEKDTTIWSEPNTAGLYGNAGKDPILTIGGYPDINYVGRTYRSLIKFKTKDITDTLNSKVSGLYSASLHLYSATANEIPTDFNIEVKAISGSWVNGTSKLDDLPVGRTGVSWKYKGAATNPWSSLGGDTYSTTVSQSFNLDSSLDLDVNVTSLVDSIYSGSISNDGFLVKIEDTYENETTSSIILKYYGIDTHTIFPPYLEVKWDDSSYSSTLDTLSTDIVTVAVKNIKEKYQNTDSVRFRLSARPKYPTRTFSTSSIYLTEYKLPANSYWGIKDEFSGEMIVDFDNTHTKISADNTSSYFDIYMNSLQPERYYRLLVKTTLNGSTIVIDNKNLFKVVRNG